MASVLKDELKRITHATAHLERSNAELREELALHGKDLDYKQAMEENIVIIARNRARIECLKEEISRIEGAASPSAHGSHAPLGGADMEEEEAPEPQHALAQAGSTSAPDGASAPDHAVPAGVPPDMMEVIGGGPNAAAAGPSSRAQAHQDSATPGQGPAEEEGMWL
jgi:hypothetical protein